jgi:photosystem II stability/assembly factor-like uncharacterized protein
MFHRSRSNHCASPENAVRAHDSFDSPTRARGRAIEGRAFAKMRGISMSVRSAIGLAALSLAVSVAGRLDVRTATQATAVDVALLQGMAWRSLGPFRPGRATAVAATPASTAVFEAVAGAGLWMTSDFGASWTAVFDAPPDGMIDAVAIAPSQPSIIYTGTASGLYRSSDGGRTWTRSDAALGAITHIAVDPVDANRLWLTAQPPQTDGSGTLWRSADGGRSIARVAAGAPTADAIDVVTDPVSASIVYVVARRRDDAGRLGAALLKSEDAGATWRALGSPTWTRAEAAALTLAVAPSRPSRLYAATRTATSVRLFRSDDGGEAWTPGATLEDATTDDAGPALAVDPADPDALLVASGSVWSSTDGVRTIAVWPSWSTSGSSALVVRGGHPPLVVLAGEDGARISVNGGRTWSARFVQPTADVSRISADSSFPYRVCGVQAPGTELCVPSRVEPDRAGLPQWQLVPLPGAGVILPDPNDPDALYGGAFGKFDRRTAQVQHLEPPDWSAPGGVSPARFSADGRTLFLGGRGIWKSTTGGVSWTRLALDLGTGTAAEGQDQVTALTTSSIDARLLWMGSQRGAIQVSRDGGQTWTTTAAAGSGAVTGLEASHFDTSSVYATFASTEPGRGPQVFRTRDFGATWVRLAQGLAGVGTVMVVREDAFRRGLLFAGTDRSLFLSFDDGDRWQPWKLNLPSTPIRDLVVHDASVIAATGGRGFWALDDISALRQITGDVARADMYLFRPAVAWRTRAVTVAGPAGDAPGPDPAPAAAVFTFLLGAQVQGPVTLEVVETGTGDVIHRYEMVAAGASTAGLHQQEWDLRYDLSAPGLRGPKVLPSTYQVRLLAGGRLLRQALTVRMDPRVRASSTDLAAQLALTRTLDDKIAALSASADAPGAATPTTRALMATLRRLVQQVEATDGRPAPGLTAAATAAVAQADILQAH